MTRRLITRLWDRDAANSRRATPRTWYAKISRGGGGGEKEEVKEDEEEA